MTLPLRRAHARIWTALPFFLAFVLLTALTARREPTPTNGDLHWKAIP